MPALYNNTNLIMEQVVPMMSVIESEVKKMITVIRKEFREEFRDELRSAKIKIM